MRHAEFYPFGRQCEDGYAGGDQEIGDEGALGGRLTGSVHAPVVSRRAADLPSAVTSQTCAGRGASCNRKWLF